MSGLRFVLFGRTRPQDLRLAWQIFQRNGRSKKAFQRACRVVDYWAILTDRNYTILAECTVDPQRGLFSTRIRQFLINDVFVEEAYRGQGYAVALILNVMYELGSVTPSFYLYAHRHNPAALRCYTKIFGPPFWGTPGLWCGRGLVTFATP